MSKPQLRLMLDSGAYSSYTMGKPIVLTEYIEFIKNNRQHIEHIINLDFIAPSNAEYAAEEGRKNFLQMRNAGIETIPVYHARERLHWLDLMLDDCPYVGLSGTSLVSPREDKEWQNFVFSYLTDMKGFPIVKTHSFGNTAPTTLLTLPYTSADSSSWMLSAGRAARIKIQGKSFQIRSSTLKDSNYILASDTGPKKQSSDEAIRALGLNPDKVLSIQGTPSQIAMVRSYLVATDLLQLQEKSRCCTKYVARPSLLSIKKQIDGGTERIDPVQVYFVVSPSALRMNFPVLASLNIKRILLSYFYINTAPASFWQEQLLPFLYDPQGFVQSDTRLKENWDFLQECML